MEEKKPSVEMPINEKRANEIVDEFFEYYEIDREEEQDEDTLRVINMSYRKLSKAVQRGRVEFRDTDEGMTVIQHTKRDYPFGNEIVYGELNGKAKVAMRKADENDQAGRMQHMMAALCKKGPSILAQLKGPDYSLMEVIAAVFFVV